MNSLVTYRDSYAEPAELDGASGTRHDAQHVQIDFGPDAGQEPFAAR